MKKRIGILLVASLLLLTACGEKKTNVETKQEGKAASAKVASSEQAKKKAKVHYNGSYYSVKGKYDEIVIANKHYPLSSDYNPGENPTAKAKLLELIAAMQREGYPISHQYSGFRSYQTQVTLYQNYVNRDGKEAADRYSARPGYSEHQSGLAFDLIDTKGNLLEETDASQWLLHHAHRYGFIVRYLEGKENSTGYMPESWHLRYIGQEAKEIAESGKSLEEYFGISGGSYQE